MAIRAFFKKPFVEPNQQESYFILFVFAIIGFSSGYEILATSEKWVLLRFGVYGLMFALPIGYFFAYRLSVWCADKPYKRRIMTLFLIAILAPCCWIYFDMPEHSHSTLGLKIFLGINALVLWQLIVAIKPYKSSLESILWLLLLWEFIISDWFINLTWKVMDYWD